MSCTKPGKGTFPFVVAQGPPAPPQSNTTTLTGGEHPMNIPRDLCRFTAIAMLASAPMTVTIAEPNPAAARATAAFVNRAEMINWLADGERGLWIQARDL